MAEAHLRLLLELVELLDRYAREVSRADLERDRETWIKVKATLETAAQCAIDAAFDLVARRALGPALDRTAAGLPRHRGTRAVGRRVTWAATTLR